jgi:hypothetical protein
MGEGEAAIASAHDERVIARSCGAQHARRMIKISPRKHNKRERGVKVQTHDCAELTRALALLPPSRRHVTHTLAVRFIRRYPAPRD